MDQNSQSINRLIRRQNKRQVLVIILLLLTILQLQQRAAISVIIRDLATQESAHFRRRGSRRGRAFIRRDRTLGFLQLVQDYFLINPVYNDKIFRRRFTMRRQLFQRITGALEARYPFFRQRRDAAGAPGFAPVQKTTAAIRLLSTGCAADSLDEYVRMGESTALSCLEHFCRGVIEVFGSIYFRKPTDINSRRILAAHEARDFPGMIGSLECTHWEWKNCPTAWADQYTGKEKVPTIVLEAIATQDLWIWHAFFGMPGSRNDINVLDQSDVFVDLIHGKAPAVNFTIINHECNMTYYLGDGIYPSWPTIVNSLGSAAVTPEECNFNVAQEAARKDVERAFGVLKGRFRILQGPARGWHREQLRMIMTACVVLHNMIVEDQRDLDEDQAEFLQAEVIPSERGGDTRDWVSRYNALRDSHQHRRLVRDLISHQWERKGRRQ